MDAVSEDDDDMVKLEIDLKKRALSDSNKEDVVTKTTKSEKTESPSHFSQNRFNPFDALRPMIFLRLRDLL
jgi:hypothetical protein